MDVEAIQQTLRRDGIDGWLFADFRGSDPLAAAILDLPAGHRSRRWFYYVPAQGHPTRIVHAIETGALDALPGRLQVYLPWQQLHELLRGVLAGAKKVAMQYSPKNNIPYVARVDAGTIDLVRSFGVEVVSSADLVSEFEATVSDRQLHSHRVAADRLGQIVQEAFGELTIRVNRGQRTTELDIQKYLVDQFAASGLEADHPPIVAIDAHSADPHYSPTSATASEFKPGQFVLIDAWCKVSGVDTVYADITWTAWLGNDIPDRQRQVFRVVRDARDAAVKYMEETLAAERPLLGCDIDDACRKVIVDAGFGDKFIHRTGHSLHTSVHGNGANLDNLESRDDRRLLPRTLVTIEPGIYLPGEFGVRSEINVYVSENGKARVTGIAPQTGILSLPCV
jgi:Xaa-Pro aminopeptidase